MVRVCPFCRAYLIGRVVDQEIPDMHVSQNIQSVKNFVSFVTSLIH